MPEDTRSPYLKEADEFLKETAESIKDDMLYWLAKEHKKLFDDARLAAGS
jgi:hypothetical protein